MRTILLALSFLMAAPASADIFWIPAENFQQHTNLALEGSPAIDNVTGSQIYLLDVDEQVRINIRVNNELREYLREKPNFRVCSLVANYDEDVINTVRARHPNAVATKSHTLDSNEYSTVCSDYASIDTSQLLTAGLRVFAPSEGRVKIRGVSIQSDEFWIPAENFNLHTNLALEGSPTVDDATGNQIYLLDVDEQVRINVRVNTELREYLRERPNFRVCSVVANYDTGVINTVRARHPNAIATRSHTLDSNEYITVCSDYGSIDTSRLLTAGLRVFAPSQGLIKIRGVTISGTSIRDEITDEEDDEEDVPESTELLADYEYSRALGYLWGDGGLTTDGNSLFYPRRNTKTSNHFGSVAEAAFGSALTQNTQGSRYVVNPDGITPANFLSNGVSLSKIPDKRAFFTSVVENEGAVLVGRITDDPNRDRCGFIRDLVNDLNPQCAANPCTNSRCTIPNCAFIAHGKYRGRNDVPGVNTHCGVYLSGTGSDWRALFEGDDYHFVKTDRTPGGEPTQYPPTSRPAYTQ